MSDRAPSSALADALTLLARRDFTEALLRERLVKRGHEEAEALSAVVRCVEYGYVDDRAYGAARARDTLRRKPSGRTALVHDLRRRGLARTMAEQAADEALSDAGGVRAVLDDAVQRWIRRHGNPGDWASIRRCSNHLQRRGFRAGDVQAALAPWLDDLGTRG